MLYTVNCLIPVLDCQMAYIRHAIGIHLAFDHGACVVNSSMFLYFEVPSEDKVVLEILNIPLPQRILHSELLAKCTFVLVHQSGGWRWKSCIYLYHIGYCTGCHYQNVVLLNSITGQCNP